MELYNLIYPNIKMDLGKIDWIVMYCIGLAQDKSQWRAVVKTVKNFGVP
jgi:hypothetical protein